MRNSSDLETLLAAERAAALERAYLADRGSLTFVHQGANRTYSYTRESQRFYLRECSMRWDVKDVLSEVQILDALRHTTYTPQIEPIRELPKGMSLRGSHVLALDQRLYWSTKHLSGVKLRASVRSISSVGDLLARFHRDAALRAGCFADRKSTRLNSSH